MDIHRIFENNRHWVAEKLQVDPDYFRKLAAGQTPEYLYIGCADSRVTAEDLMGLNPDLEKRGRASRHAFPGRAWERENLHTIIVPRSAGKQSLQLLLPRHSEIAIPRDAGQ